MSVQIHPSSVVSPEARLDEGVVVGPFCLIEGNAVIGARYDATEIMNGVTEVLSYGTAVEVVPISQ